MKIALEKTKAITKIVREKWANKDQEFSLLDSSQQVTRRRIKSKNDDSQTQFIQNLNEELEKNRMSHPSQEDDADMNQEMADEKQDEKLIELVKDHG
jgi:hypothetical protein